MSIEKIAPFALALALLAASLGQLPKIINAVRCAEFQLIEDSKASSWPKALMLKPFRPDKGQKQYEGTFGNNGTSFR